MVDRIQAFTMPKWGIEMEEGVIREWHAQEGQTVKEGDLFAVIETDKIANDVELEYTATLRRRLGEEEETYPVGALIAVFAEPDVPDAEIDAFVEAFKPADAGFGEKDDAGEADDARGAGAPSAAPEPAAIPEGLSISPKAADLAQSLGVDLTLVEGSGRNGRISLQDVEQAAKAQGLASGEDEEDGTAADNPYEVVKLSSMRRTIAKRLTEAKQTVPHFYLRKTIAMDALVALRARLKEETGSAPSVNDYIVRACAVALMETPDANVCWADDAIHRYAHADISVAVAVPGGLVTPVIRRADEKSVAQIAAEMKDLAGRARAEKLEQRDYAGGTFSVSNLGMYGVDSFDAVVNPPMGAILAVGAVQRAAVEADGGVGFSDAASMTLSCDHRAIDGAAGGQFLRALKAALEAPEAL